MGVNDRRRFRVFAEFIRGTYPAGARVADVGGSRGSLSWHLRVLGFHPTIVDVRDSRHPRWVHRELRKKSRDLGRLVGIPRLTAKVQDVDLSPFDLLVGLHPDEATEPLVRAALGHGKDFAVVPCCVFPLDGVRRSREGWLAYLASLSPEIRRAELPVQGANVVLYRAR
jgi:hypothetical protein